MGYLFPPTDLLNKTGNKTENDREHFREMANRIVEAMKMYNCNVKVIDIRETDLSICYEIVPDEGNSVKSILKAKQDLELALASSIEIVNGPNNNSFIIIVLKSERPVIGLRKALESIEFQSAESPLSVVTGINYNGGVMVADIEQLPHMLIAGTTGSGKTVFLDDIILSLVYKSTPEQVGLVLIDPKLVDLALYNGIPHLLGPVVYGEKETFAMLDWVETEMMRRNELFAQNGVKNIQSYNEKQSDKFLKQIVVIIDEYSQLMMDYRKNVEDIIDRIGRLGRSAGIHLIIATQRPTADVVTSSIKFNLPCRASFTVVDGRESKGILERGGAQRLLGSGDMLFSLNTATGVEHAQAPFVSEEEIKAVVAYVAEKNETRG